MSEKITAMIEEIKGLSVLELAEPFWSSLSSFMPSRTPSVSPPPLLPLLLPVPPLARSWKRRPSSTSS